MKNRLDYRNRFSPNLYYKATFTDHNDIARAIERIQSEDTQM